MIAHVVLFRPRPDLSDDEATQLVNAFQQATTGIPSVRRAHVGRRVTFGRGYESMMRVDFSYAAVLEFDDLDGLREYLDHPAHEQIGNAIFGAATDILVYDFQMGAASEVGPSARPALG